MSAASAAVPKRVKKQVEEAKRLQQELINDPAGKGDAGTDLNDPPDKSKEKLALVEDIGETDVTNDPPDKGPENWEKRFKGLKRMHDSTVRDLRSQLTEATLNIETLTQKVEEMQVIPAADAVVEEEVELTEEELNEYGPTLVSLVSKVSKKELGKQIVDLTQRLENLEKGQSDAKAFVEKKVESDFHAELSRLTKAQGMDWREVNRTKGFVEYLDGVVPNSGGLTRQNLLSSAQSRGDAETVATFFTEYAALTKQGSDTGEEVSVLPEEGGGGGGGNDIPQGKLYTGAEITKFYKDKREGRYEGREEEARRIERDILAATNEGRIL